jgi:hypothetical protein
MIKKYKALICVILLSGVCLLFGCVSVQLSQPLPKNTKVGVLSTYKNQADFKYLGTTIFQHSKYKHSLPDLQLNSKITKLVSKTLKEKGHKAIAINNMKIKSGKIIAQPEEINVYITDYGKTLLTQLKQQYGLNYLLIIKPYYVSPFGDSESSLLALYGYGIFYNGSIFNKKAYIAGGYRINLIRLSDFKILAQQNGEFKKEVDIKIWKDQYKKISKKDLQYIAQTIENNLTASINSKVVYMMQLN